MSIHLKQDDARSDLQRDITAKIREKYQTNDVDPSQLEATDFSEVDMGSDASSKGIFLAILVTLAILGLIIWMIN